MPDATACLRDAYEEQAPHDDRVVADAERLLPAGGRESTCSLAAGDVLEVGMGTGRHLPSYPPGVRLTGIELSGVMLSRAEARSRRTARALRPGGRSLLLDHVVVPSWAVRGIRRLLDRVRPARCRSPLRDPEGTVVRTGSVVEERTRSRGGVVLCLSARQPSAHEPHPGHRLRSDPSDEE